ncbi:MAG: hypothetical protein ACREF5_02870 [Candidatus Saccharimonadales bacterium]
MTKQKSWFIKTRGSYLPCSWQGWLTYIPYLAYMIGVLVFVEIRGDNFWLAIFTVVPNWISASVIMTWVARHKS